MRVAILFLLLISSIINIESSESEISLIKMDLTPIISKCSYMKDLFDDEKYLKTACFVHQALSYEEAKYKCAEYNMNLFVLNDENVASHLLDAAQEKYPGEKQWLWINGKRFTTSKKWLTFTTGGSVLGPLNKSIKFYSNHEFGNCLRIAGKYTGIYGVLPGRCEEKSYFACEHSIQTQDPPQLDIRECVYNRHLFNYNKYIKTMCFSQNGSGYDHARRKCASYGMNLFMFDSEETDEAFFENAIDILETYPTGHFYVNGVRNPQTNEWNLYYANRTLKGPIYKDFEFINVKGTYGVSSGDYLLISGQAGPYQGFGLTPDRGSWIICEYFIENM